MLSIKKRKITLNLSWKWIGRKRYSVQWQPKESRGGYNYVRQNILEAKKLSQEEKRVLYNDKKINSIGRYMNYKDRCTQHHST